MLQKHENSRFSNCLTRLRSYLVYLVNRQEYLKCIKFLPLLPKRKLIFILLFAVNVILNLFNTRRWDLIVLFQELQQLVHYQSCTKVPPIKWRHMTILWNCGYSLNRNYVLKIDSWELKISFFRNSTKNNKFHSKPFKKGVDL